MRTAALDRSQTLTYAGVIQAGKSPNGISLAVCTKVDCQFDPGCGDIDSVLYIGVEVPSTGIALRENRGRSSWPQAGVGVDTEP